MGSLYYSFKLAITCTFISTILGTTVALYIVRFSGRWREHLRLLILLPLLLPEILTAISLLFFYYNFDMAIEEAARSLGAGRFTTFRRVTLPIIKPGIIAGALLALIVSYDLFAISFLLKPIGTATLPIQLFDYVRWEFDPTAAAVSTVSIVFTLVVLFITERLVGLRALRF